MNSYSQSKQKGTIYTNRQNMELIVRNLPEHFNKQDLIHYLYKTLEMCRGLIRNGNPIVDSSYHAEGGRSLTIVFRSVQEAMNCLQLDRIYYGKKVLSISNKHIKGPVQSSMNVDKVKRVSEKVYDQFRKIYVGNIPYMPSYELLNYLAEFGELRSFIDLTKDTSSSECYCQYINDEVTEEAILKLNKEKLKGRSLIAKRAVLLNPSETSRAKITKHAVSTKFEKNMSEFYTTFDTVGYFKNKNISCVLILKEIIPSSAGTNTNFVLTDIKKQVERIGPLARMTHKGLNVYLEYEKVEYAQIAYLLLGSRKYDGKMVDVSFYDPIKFADDILL